MAGMGARGRRPGVGGGGGDGSERVRTHMMFSEKSADKTGPKKRKRGKQGKLPSTRVHQNDAGNQTGETDDIDPTEWTGNQRVVHFGPMGARDPFFYYYPKGWDILYPAAFGFFPYRTKTFRGSTPTVCMAAFGTFFTIGGAGMTWLGYFFLHPKRRPWDDGGPTSALDRLMDIPPIQIAGPALLVLGLLCILLGGCWWFWGLNLCSERLRHRQPHHKPPRRTVHQRPLPEVVPRETAEERNPYVPPPPPAFTVIHNAHTEQFLYTPENEMKLYPPVMPGYSTLSLAHSSAYVGSPYNTLGSSRGYRQGRGRSLTGGMGDIVDQWPEYHAANLQHKNFTDT